MLSVEDQAKDEIEQEEHRESVDLLKIKIRKKKTLRELLFPWTITIQRINK